MTLGTALLLAGLLGFVAGSIATALGLWVVLNRAETRDV